MLDVCHNNNNNSYTALYPVNIYELVALYTQVVWKYWSVFDSEKVKCSLSVTRSSKYEAKAIYIGKRI